MFYLCWGSRRVGHLKHLTAENYTCNLSQRGSIWRNRKTVREVQENRGKSLSDTLSGPLKQVQDCFITPFNMSKLLSVI